MPQTMLFSERLFASRPSAGRRARLRVQAAAAGGSGAGARKGLPPANAATVAMRGGAEASTSTSGEPRDRPLILGGTTVEDEALAAALQTLAASQAGALPPRRLVYECADVLQAAYDRCGEVTEDYGRTFYMGACRRAGRPGGEAAQLESTARPARTARTLTPRPLAATQLMTEQRRKAIWAIYGAPQPAPVPRARSQPLAHAQPSVWCRRTDELVDGPNSPYITPAALDRWKERLEAVFAGRPFDLLDAALTDTVASFPVDITPFYDMIDGMRMDLVKTRYATFDELYEYCYRVAGTVALMSVPIMGCAPRAHARARARRLALAPAHAPARAASPATTRGRRSQCTGRPWVWGWPTSSQTSCATWARMRARAAACTSRRRT